MYNVYEIRKDFPIIRNGDDNNSLVYLDTSASAQKPMSVINALHDVYTKSYANPHRGTYTLSDNMTSAYEKARTTAAKFINATSAKEIIFTRNATESINLVASSWGRQNLHSGDEVLISQMEHHANLVPWQQICLQTGAKLSVFAVADNGAFIEEEFLSKLSENTKMVAVSAMSNVLGTVFPIKSIAAAAHNAGAKVLVDACQFAVHRRIDVRDFDCDFLAFSGHKTYGPTGIGVLYGKADILHEMPPYQYGGDMVDTVTYEKTTFADIPARFEAGTPAAVQAIGMAAGLEYIMNTGIDEIMAHEEMLTEYTNERLMEIPNLKIIGTAQGKGGVFSFDIKGIHPQDIAFILNKENIAVRIGHHCAQPIVNRMGYTSLIRASLGMYSSKEDIDALVKALMKAIKFFREN